MSTCDYAEAALAGLPADDEAAVLARLATASGKTLQDLIDFSYASGGVRSTGGGLRPLGVEVEALWLWGSPVAAGAHTCGYMGVWVPPAPCCMVHPYILGLRAPASTHRGHMGMWVPPAPCILSLHTPTSTHRPHTQRGVGSTCGHAARQPPHPPHSHRQWGRLALAGHRCRGTMRLMPNAALVACPPMALLSFQALRIDPCSWPPS